MFVLLMLAAGAVLAYLPMTDKPPSALRSIVKTVPLAACAILAAGMGAPGLLVAGFALSALGDLALSRTGDRAFLLGLCAFAAAHVCYVVLFAGLVEVWLIWPVILLGLLALSTEWWLAPHTGELRWPVRIYVGLICAMGVAGFALPDGLRLASLGAALFMVSDIILAVQLFRLPQRGVRARWAGYVLWMLYAGGQGAILLAFLQGVALS